MDKNNIATEVTTYLLLNNVKKFHGLPLSLTLERNIQFISKSRKISARFWVLKFIYL